MTRSEPDKEQRVVKPSVKITKGENPVMVVCDECHARRHDKCNGKALSGKFNCLCKFQGHRMR